jgi:DNA-binding NtrC family response regulator
MQTADAGPTWRILVVDDEPALRTLCQRLVWSLGHECEVAENSVAVSRLVSEGWFDVILCDYRLHGETAHAVVAAIATVAPKMVSRVVITSGATTDSDVVALADQYGLTLISKPYGSHELASAIDLVVTRQAER